MKSRQFYWLLLFSFALNLNSFGFNSKESKDSNTYKVIGEKKGVKIRENKKRKKGDFKNLHLDEQNQQIMKLRKKGYAAGFGVGLSKCLCIVDYYMTGRFDLMKQQFLVLK